MARKVSDGRPVAVATISCLIVMPLAEQRGGAELALLHLLEHGRCSGIVWTVAFFSEGSMVDLIRSWGVNVYVIDAGRLRQLHRMTAAILRLRRIIRDVKADVAFSWMRNAHFYCAPAALLEAVPTIWYQWGLSDPVGWEDRLAAALPARSIFACSKFTATAHSRLWPHRATTVIRPGVDLSKFDPNRLPSQEDCRRKLGLSPQGPLIGIVGRLQHWKGMHHLVDAMPRILQEYPDAHAVIVGGEHSLEPGYPAFLRGRIDSLGLVEQVIIAGFQSNVPEWMQAMDVIVHASDAEPFGIVVIEAMSLSKPLVAADVGGPQEVITDRVNGRLITPGNSTALSQAILDLLPDNAQNRALRANARARAADFSVQRFAAAVSDEVRANVNDSLSTRETDADPSTG